MPPEVLATLARHRAEVGRMLEQISDEVLATWVRAWSDIEAELLRDWPESRIQQRRHLEQARRMAATRITEAADATGVALTRRARAMIERGMWEQPELIAAQMPTQMQASILRPPSIEVDDMVARVQQQITARTWVLSADATQAMNRALVLGTAKGENPRDTARRMVKQTQGVFNGGLQRAQVIARTEMIDAHRNAATASQDANADVLAGWMWVAQLGPRTCPSCVVQHGQMHDLDEPGPLDHQQGRCARVPVTKTWAELGFAGIDEPPRPKAVTGEEWFNQQPESVQRSILGPKRYEAWKNGDYPPEAWSQRRTTDGWRDSYGVGPVGGTSGAAGAAPTGPEPTGPKPLRDMDDAELEAQMMQAMEAGDFALADAAGAELDSRFYTGDGARIDPSNPHTPTVYDWYEQQDAATQERYFNALSQHDQQTFHEAQWAHTTGRATRTIPTVRQRRKEYADWLDQEWVRAEAATNGNMLSRTAKAKGVAVTDLWKVNAATARSWASEELLEYWDTHGRMTVADWLASYAGAESTSTLNAGMWLQ